MEQEIKVGTKLFVRRRDDWALVTNVIAVHKKYVVDDMTYQWNLPHLKYRGNAGAWNTPLCDIYDPTDESQSATLRAMRVRSLRTKVESAAKQCDDPDCLAAALVALKPPADQAPQGRKEQQ